jgi:Holliday junction DNA helicase RuvA
VIEGDLDALTLVSGVGKRTAQRLMIELAAKLNTPVSEPSLVGGVTSARGEARAALEGLGYAPEEIRDILPRVEDGPVEVMLKEALKLLGMARTPKMNGAGRA